MSAARTSDMDMVPPALLYYGPHPPPRPEADRVPRDPSAAAPAEWRAPDASSAAAEGGLFGRRTAWQVDLVMRPIHGPFARRRHAHGENLDISETMPRRTYEPRPPPPGAPADTRTQDLGVFAVEAPVAMPAGAGPFISLQATAKTTYDTWDSVEGAAGVGGAAEAPHPQAKQSLEERRGCWWLAAIGGGSFGERSRGVTMPWNTASGAPQANLSSYALHGRCLRAACWTVTAGTAAALRMMWCITPCHKVPAIASPRELTLLILEVLTNKEGSCMALAYYGGRCSGGAHGVACEVSQHVLACMAALAACWRRRAHLFHPWHVFRFVNHTIES